MNMVFEVLVDFLLQHGLYLVFLILILVCYGIGYAYIGVWFKNKQKDIIKLKSKWLDKNIWDNIEILGKILFTILMLGILILLTAEVYEWFKNLFWDSFSCLGSSSISASLQPNVSVKHASGLMVRGIATRKVCLCKENYNYFIEIC